MANRDFMTDYQRGNAYVWGRVTGESQTGRKVLKDILSSGSQFEKFQNAFTDLVLNRLLL